MLAKLGNNLSEAIEVFKDILFFESFVLKVHLLNDFFVGEVDSMEELSVRQLDFSLLVRVEYYFVDSPQLDEFLADFFIGDVFPFCQSPEQTDEL